MQNRTLIVMSTIFVLALATIARANPTNGLVHAWSAGANAGGGVVKDLIGNAHINLGSGAILETGPSGPEINFNATEAAASPFTTPVNVPDTAVTIEVWARDLPDLDDYSDNATASAAWNAPLFSYTGDGGEKYFGLARGRCCDYQAYFAAGTPGQGSGLTDGMGDGVPNNGGDNSPNFSYDYGLYQYVLTVDMDGKGADAGSTNRTDVWRVRLNGTNKQTGRADGGGTQAFEYQLSSAPDLYGVGSGFDAITGNARPNNGFDGSILAINIFDRALTNEEISRLYDGGAGYIASLPEPATVTLLGIGGLAMLRRRRAA
ncbi:MAG: PEP-CTERM sorting domain-containing protein [Phycisphaeraceae bacterium]|nr:PEP-CTERM sorting domain-containing protein [Phycisphaeraceae bacterium]